MTEMNPFSFDVLLRHLFQEYEKEKSIYHLHEKFFYRPMEGSDFSCTFRGERVSTPLGPAAGPHTQLAQNILCAWLAGARIIELKTIQVMDTLEIPRPCIDATNICYNVEWSQELTVPQSLEEYVKAWFLVHILKSEKTAGLAEEPSPLFDLSVGYDLKGIQGDKVMGFIRGMKDASRIIEGLRKEIPAEFERFRDLPLSPCLASGVTLSTFHGCPPEEIEKIAVFLLKNAGLNTVIKLNPTLLGKERLKEILNHRLGYHSIEVPAEAFTKDLQFDTAVSMVGRLMQVAQAEGRHFGVKFNNTLVVKNQGKRFEPSEMYMSGRPLHVIGMNLVSRFRKIFGESLPISFSAGIDAQNFAQAAACNLVPITVCTDILRPGGYSRMARYLENLAGEMKTKGASNREQFILNYDEQGKKAWADLMVQRNWVQKEEGNPVLKKFAEMLREKLLQQLPSFAFQEAKEFALSLAAEESEKTILALNELYANAVKLSASYNTSVAIEHIEKDERYRAYENRAYSPKVGYKARQFDCISAPCTYACPVHINVPLYIDLIKRGKFMEAIDVIRQNNPLPLVCGRVCSHPCETACRQRQWDAPVAIRELKRVVADFEYNDPNKVATQKIVKLTERKRSKVAIVGSGPAGLTAAHFLALEGYPVTIYEALEKPGGMLAYGIPEFRLPAEAMQKEIERLESLGVEIRCNVRIGRGGIPLKQLQEEGFGAIFIAIGAYRSRKLAIEGENSPQCVDCLAFLKDVREGKSVDIGKKVAIIGGGNAAIDAARTAWRLQSEEVFLVYRRTRFEMPANREEVEELEKEGIQIHELAAPIRLIKENEQIVGLECIKTRLEKSDKSGRPRPVPIEGSNFVLPVDRVIVAISQEPQMEELMDGMRLETSADQTLIVDQETLSSRTKGIFGGGDVVRGPQTIIQAMGDGRDAATMIGQYLEGKALSKPPIEHKSLSFQGDDIQVPWKYQRQSPDLLPLEERKNFQEVEHALSLENAKIEASRCLQCDLRCGICIEVCPNRANFFFDVVTECTPYNVLGCRNGEAVPVGRGIYEVRKNHQIGNLGDVCNECGNCDNFCPETGGPYRSKSTFFRTLEGLKKSTRNGFYLQKRGNKVEMWGRMEGAMYSLSVNLDDGKAFFGNEAIRVELQFKDGLVLSTECKIPYSNETLSLEKFLIMRTLVQANTGLWLE